MCPEAPPAPNLAALAWVLGGGDRLSRWWPGEDHPVGPGPRRKVALPPLSWTLWGRCPKGREAQQPWGGTQCGGHGALVGLGALT